MADLMSLYGDLHAVRAQDPMLQGVTQAGVLGDKEEALMALQRAMLLRDRISNRKPGGAVGAMSGAADMIRQRRQEEKYLSTLRKALESQSGIDQYQAQLQAIQEQIAQEQEMQRKAAIAQQAGWPGNQSRAVAEGIDLPKRPELPKLIQTLEAAGIDPQSPQGQQIIRENLTKSQVSVNTGLPKPQAGYMWNPDQTQQVPIPGTPQALEAEAAQQSRSETEQKRVFSAQNVLSAIDRLKKNTGPMTAGWGGLLAEVPATAAKTYKNDLNTVMSNLAFDRLQEMRNASKTGGALGQVSNIELELLKSTVAGLEQTQHPEDLRERLDIVAGNYERYVDALSGKVPQGYEVKEIPGRGRFIKVDGQWYPL